MKLQKPIAIVLLPMIFAGFGVFVGRYLMLSNADYQVLMQRINLLESTKPNATYDENIESLKHRVVKLEKLVSNNNQASSETKSGVSDYLISLEERQNALEEYVYTQSAIPEKSVASQSLDRDTSGSPAINTLARGAETKINKGMQLLDKAVNDGVLNIERHEQLDKILVAADNESKKMLWERMFADIQAGKYELPNEEASTDYYELPDGEVVAE